MMGFTNTWRKRLACERCRHLKVRCEYASPTDDTCIRCDKSKAQCIIATPKRKPGGNAIVSSGNYGKNQLQTPSPESNSMELDDDVGKGGVGMIQESKEEHAVYLQQIVTDAMRKLEEMNVSPLAQAIATGLYTTEEAQESYDFFLKNPVIFPVISLLQLPNDILKLDATWPTLAISIVSSRALNSANKPLSKIMVFIRDLFNNDIEKFGQSLTLDRLSGLALLCQYSLMYREDWGLTTLFHFHSMAIAVMRKYHAQGRFKEEKIALHLSASTLLPFTLVKKFHPLNQIVQFYYNTLNAGLDVVDQSTNCECCPEHHYNSDTQAFASDTKIFTTSLLIEVLLGYQRGMSMLVAATNICELSSIIENTLQSITLLEDQQSHIQTEFAQLHSANTNNSTVPKSEDLSLYPLRGCYLMVKSKLLKFALTRILDLTSIENYESPNIILCLQNAVSQASNICSQMFRLFAYADNQKPFLPTSMFYYVPEALITMQLTRFIAFAGAVDIDVRSDCLTEVIMLKWEEMVRVNMLARHLFMLILPALDCSNVKVGEYSYEDAVVGSGSMTEFNIIFCDGNIKKVRNQYRITREAFRDLMQNEIKKKDIGGASSSWFENTDTLTLPTVIHLLIHRL